MRRRWRAGSLTAPAPGTRRGAAGRGGPPRRPGPPRRRTRRRSGVRPAGRVRRERARPGGYGPPRDRRRRGGRRAGLDAGLPAHAHRTSSTGPSGCSREGGRHGDGRPAASARPTASGPSAPGGSAACSTTSASPPTAGSPPSAGTRPATSSCTSPPPCTGRVLHTLNIRLFPEQLTYIVNHAEDEVIFVDRSLVGAAVAAARHVQDGAPRRRDGRRQGRRARCPDGGRRDARLRGRCWPTAEPVEFARRRTRTGPRRCATRAAPPATRRASCTRHRSTFLHTMGVMTADSLGVRERDVILPVVPMFHANAWGLAHAARGARRRPGDARAGPLAAGHRRPDRGGEGHRRGRACRRSGWACCPSSRAATHRACAAIPCGGSAVPRSLSEAYRRADRPADPAGVGHDRDAARSRRSGTSSRRSRDADRRRAGRAAHDGRHRRRSASSSGSSTR